MNKKLKCKVSYHNICHGTIVNIMDNVSKKSPFRLENSLYTFHWLHKVLVSPYDRMDQSSHQGGNANVHKKDYHT